MIHVCVNVVQSYGGFLASHAVANDIDIFPCSVSGADVSDRRYYGTVICLLPTHKHNPLLYSVADTDTHIDKHIHTVQYTSVIYDLFTATSVRLGFIVCAKFGEQIDDLLEISRDRT